MKRLILFTPLLLASGGIFYLSHQPMNDYLRLDFILSDKFLHLCGYFCYGLTILTASFSIFTFGDRKKIILFLLIFGAFFAMSDEIHQSYIPGRNCDIFDWIADMIGLSFSIFLLNPIANILGRIKLIEYRSRNL